MQVKIRRSLHTDKNLKLLKMTIPTVDKNAKQPNSYTLLAEMQHDIARAENSGSVLIKLNIQLS